MVAVDFDIRTAKTLSSSYYTDESLFQRILLLIQSKWKYIGHDSEFELNMIKPFQIGNEPLLVTKDEQGYSCLSNICTHRGMILQDKVECKKTLICPYHGRTFSLDGVMKNMPEFEQAIDFPSKNDNLNSHNLEQWNNLIFVSLNSDEKLSKWINQISERMSFLEIDNFSYDASRERNYQIKANWALYVDNYLEGFHIPFVHKDLNDVLDFNQYETELFEGGVLQIGIAKEGEECFKIPSGHRDSGRNIAAYYWWLYPNVMFNFYPWGLSLNVVSPQTVDTTEISYYGFVRDSNLLGKGAGGDLDKVELEDQFIVESCQKGMESNNYDSGRYSPTMEKGIFHFHRMLSKIE